MKKMYFFFGCMFLYYSLRAQHCPFDGTGLLVVAVKGADSSDFSAEYLLLSVRDAYGQIVYHGGRPLVFVPNPRKTDTERNTYEHNRIAYGFAGRHFILTLPAALPDQYRTRGGLYIYANPISGTWMPVVYKINPADIYNIHYLNAFLSGQTRTEPVPENSQEPFRHLVRLMLPDT